MHVCNATSASHGRPARRRGERRAVRPARRCGARRAGRGGALAASGRRGGAAHGGPSEAACGRLAATGGSAGGNHRPFQTDQTKIVRVVKFQTKRIITS
uniref:Uncharacterized protein n=1 Tax=Oryza sativa subsp. japonica TaxID=39947 RepID=Q6EN35_ORYSJ|nr:hypothetical protein [Oryza sativa Japonica Group]BAD29700.1 hypothetical protein [Oryza sativa Japonica Group]